MDQVLSLLSVWYREDRLLYAVVSVAAMLVVGTLLGLLMDWVGRMLGVHPCVLRHHRRKVKR